MGEVGNQDALRVQLFSLLLLLSGSAFAWFTTLPANSILYWADLETQFHQFFFSGVTELKLTDLTGLRQRNDESVASFIERFRDVKNRCYSLVLSDQQLADAAFNGLFPHIKDKYASQEFESISQIASRMIGETRSYESKKPFQQKINYVEYSADHDSNEEQETVASAEWVENSKKLVMCLFGKKEPELYGFDIPKADKIFDLLLSEGLIKLKPYRKIPSEEELKNMKYCKWHNAMSHDTKECKVFRQQI